MNQLMIPLLSLPSISSLLPFSFSLSAHSLKQQRSSVFSLIRKKTTSSSFSFSRCCSCCFWERRKTLLHTHRAQISSFSTAAAFLVLEWMLRCLLCCLCLLHFHYHSTHPHCHTELVSIQTSFLCSFCTNALNPVLLCLFCSLSVLLHT